MPSDKTLTDANFYPDGATADRTRALQPWGDVPHGPVFLYRRTEGQPLVFAYCYSCQWAGPDRWGDPNSHRLVEDDAVAHYHQHGVRCGCCEACLPDGALRYSWHATVEALKEGGVGG